MDHPYKNKDICKLTGCSHRQLQYWELKGYINPVYGSRNIRYYSEDDLNKIKQIIDNKKNGKSLGEAFVISSQHLNPNNLDSEYFSHTNEVEKEWLQVNEELLTVLETIYHRENSIPRFPYFIYNQTELEDLKDLQEEAKKLKQKKDSLWILITESNNRLIEALPKEPEELPKVELKKDTPAYSPDQLVILWIKKFGNTNTSEIRDLITKRLLNGESIESISDELQA
ncbi:MAG: helix-turn-helix domain-containing protein [Candidatus Margulisbacteria bacterium]|nr:helix-turn-helix domain-containing protein [Candidatus Margulisiibacteriota bacterium]